MCGLWFYSPFLIMAVFLSICQTGNSQTRPAPEFQVRCQGSIMKLKCDNKSHVVSIKSVFYGRKQPGATICPSPTSSLLSDEITCKKYQNNVTTEVIQICEYKNSCNFTVEKETFRKDGCPRVYKYMYVEYICVFLDRSLKAKKNVEVLKPVTSLAAIVTSTITSTLPMTSQVSSTEAIQSTSTLAVNVDRLVTISYEPQTSIRSSSISSSRPHSVSVTPVSHTEQLLTEQLLITSVAIERPSIKTTKPASKTYENSATSAGQHGTMKLFRFILSFHIIHEEKIRKHTASSVVWFMFGLLVGLFIMIAVLVYYRVKQVRRENKDKPNKAAYSKQKNCTDGTIEEKVILHPKELEALEMESQLGETV